jgi:hypothetical protein
MIKQTTITTFPISDLHLMFTNENIFNPSLGEKHNLLTYGTINTNKIFNLKQLTNNQFLSNLVEFRKNCENKNIEFLFTLPTEIMPLNELKEKEHIFWAKGVNDKGERVNYYFIFDAEKNKFIEKTKKQLNKTSFNQLFVDIQVESRNFHDYLYSHESLESRKKAQNIYYSESLISLIDKISQPEFLIKDTLKETQIKLIPSFLNKRENFSQQNDLLVFNDKNKTTVFDNPFDFFENLNVSTDEYHTIYGNSPYGITFCKIKHDFGYTKSETDSNKRLNFSSMKTKKESTLTGTYTDYEQTTDYNNYYKKGNIYSYEETKSIYQYKDMLSRKLYHQIIESKSENNIENCKKILADHLKSPYFDINYHNKRNSDVAHYIFNNDLDELMIDFVKNDYDIEQNQSLQKEINYLDPEKDTKKFSIYEKLKIERSKFNNKTVKENVIKIKL